MFDWFRKKTKTERLQKRYSILMKKSYDSALKDKEESEKARIEAQKIYKEIEYLNVGPQDISA